MSNAKKISIVEQIKDRFSVCINGLDMATTVLADLKNSWFLGFRKTTERDFLEAILPKIKELEEKFDKELEEVLKRESKNYLK